MMARRIPRNSACGAISLHGAIARNMLFEVFTLYSFRHVT